METCFHKLQKLTDSSLETILVDSRPLGPEREAYYLKPLHRVQFH